MWLALALADMVLTRPALDVDKWCEDPELTDKKIRGVPAALMDGCCYLAMQALACLSFRSRISFPSDCFPVLAQPTHLDGLGHRSEARYLIEGGMRAATNIPKYGILCRQMEGGRGRFDNLMIAPRLGMF